MVVTLGSLGPQRRSRTRYIHEPYTLLRHTTDDDDDHSNSTMLPDDVWQLKILPYVTDWRDALHLAQCCSLWYRDWTQRDAWIYLHPVLPPLLRGVWCLPPPVASWQPWRSALAYLVRRCQVCHSACYQWQRRWNIVAHEACVSRFTLPHHAVLLTYELPLELWKHCQLWHSVDRMVWTTVPAEAVHTLPVAPQAALDAVVQRVWKCTLSERQHAVRRCTGVTTWGQSGGVVQLSHDTVRHRPVPAATRARCPTVDRASLAWAELAPVLDQSIRNSSHNAKGDAMIRQFVLPQRQQLLNTWRRVVGPDRGAWLRDNPALCERLAQWLLTPKVWTRKLNALPRPVTLEVLLTAAQLNP